jgi:hypothetical protein
LDQNNLDDSIIIIKTLICLLEATGRDREELISKGMIKAFRQLGIKLKGINSKLYATDTLLTKKIDDNDSNREWLKETTSSVNRYKDTIKKSYQGQRESLCISPMFIAARRWNSWTPSQPHPNTSMQDFQKKNGGGYFISDGKFRIAIDPGWGFIRSSKDFS